MQKYWYDDNGNMTRRDVGGATTYLSYDAENRLVGASGAASAEFIYDGDGNRVASVISGTLTVYIGGYYEWTSNSAKKYYYAGSSRLALRDGGTLYYLFGDHLGSTSKSYRVDNGAETTQLYKAWGESRFSDGNLPSQYHYTGQFNEISLGLYYYGARWYDPSLGRFAQADSIVPNPSNVQSWDRYAYVNYSPVMFNDPSGHSPAVAIHDSYGDSMSAIFVSVNVNKASYFKGATRPGTQYVTLDNGRRYTQLCGYISLNAIYETVTGLTDTLENFIYARDLYVPGKGDKGSGDDDIGTLLKIFFSSDYQMTVYNGQATYLYTSDRKYPALLKNGGGNWWVDSSGTDVMQQMITDMLAQGHYLIAGCGINTETGHIVTGTEGVDHWVVITGMVGGSVQIYNPFTNAIEYYPWEEFEKSFTNNLKFLMEIYEAPPPPDPVYGDKM